VKGEIFIYEVALSIIKLQEKEIVNVRIKYLLYFLFNPKLVFSKNYSYEFIYIS
jgi:hypothetical protein